MNTSNFRSRFLSLLVLSTLVALPASAEKSDVNLHLAPGVGIGLDNQTQASKLVFGAALKIDTTLLKFMCGNSFCLAPQLELYGIGANSNQYLAQGQMFGGGLGLRMRLFNDEKGYLVSPGQPKRKGNLWGGWWIDAHVTLADSAFGVGFDTATGVELSLIEGLSVGPFAKLQWTRPNQLLMFGLEFTVGAPQATPAESDFDNDGIVGDADKCPEEAEDVDGFEDADGCPDKDNDKDGVEDPKDQCKDKAEDKDGFQDEDGCPELDNDADGIEDRDDKCPDKAGPKENKGCPDTDKDGDGIVDRLDKCVDVKGIKENDGCADVDTDGDTIVDRLDKCPAEKGEVDNNGCAWPDDDKDGVVNKLDNCPTEAGVAANQGCPEAKKQQVAITGGRLVLKDKVYFDTGKGSIQKKSFPLLDQVAGILVAHTEIKSLRIEGHTDNVGKPEKNKALSQDRANAVKDYLSKKGVDAARMTAIGFGQEKPAEPNDTAKGREANRRVDFFIE